VEYLGYLAGDKSLMNFDGRVFLLFLCGTVGFSVWTALVSIFASSVSKSFLQAIGIAFATFTVLTLCVPAFANGHMLFLFDRTAPNHVLSLFVAVPTVIVMLSWLTYLNYVNFRDGWPLWRRTLVAMFLAICFINGAGAAIYHRAWEVFEPAEPAHGPAKLSLANPAELLNESYHNLVVRLPDGRVWFDYLGSAYKEEDAWRRLEQMVFDPLPHSAGPRKFIEGSDWASASARHLDEQFDTTDGHARQHFNITGYIDSIGIKNDGTLWVSDRSDQKIWTADRLTRVGDETNWLQFVRGHGFWSVLLLKKDGTLWLWGTNHVDWSGWPQSWPGLRAFEPRQISKESNWAAIYSAGGTPLARRTDGSVWVISGNNKTGKEEFSRWMTNFSGIVTQNYSQGSYINEGAYVRDDGTLWVYGYLHGYDRGKPEFEVAQCNRDTNWVAVARSRDSMVAIKSDGTLWQWPAADFRNHLDQFSAPPSRLGIHRDWISVTAVEGGVVSLAADGSVWFWPAPGYYQFREMWVQLPKQPQFIGNVFASAN
jgi:hypothetical protein